MSHKKEYNMKKGLTVLVMCFLAVSVNAGPVLKFIDNIFLVSPVSDSPRWELKPSVLLSWVEVSRNSEKELVASALSGKGGGLMLQRTINRDGQNYSAFSIGLAGIFGPIMPERAYVKFSGAITANVMNNLFGVGMKFDGKAVSGLICTNINLTNN
jgi:hypothetical protein